MHESASKHVSQPRWHMHQQFIISFTCLPICNHTINCIYTTIVHIQLTSPVEAINYHLRHRPLTYLTWDCNLYRVLFSNEGSSRLNIQERYWGAWSRLVLILSSDQISDGSAFEKNWTNQMLPQQTSNSPIMKKASHQVETYPGDRLIISLQSTL